MLKPGILYIVATPIGNPEDITLRAIRVLKEADALICEEFRNGSRLLKKLEIPQKEIIPLNEHNEDDQIEAVLLKLAQGNSLALVSDCGTPLFSDPGHKLVSMVSTAGFRVTPVPGVSSLAAAISVTPIHMKTFYFAGFLPRVPKDRVLELKRISAQRGKTPVLIMDTPYRLAAVLKDVCSVFGKKQMVTLTCNLTMPNERVITAPCADVLRMIGAEKAEFMLVLH
jgi:16S rRNA (cytidine1402-2'-O)-methyltransferase